MAEIERTVDPSKLSGPPVLSLGDLLGNENFWEDVAVESSKPFVKITLPQARAMLSQPIPWIAYGATHVAPVPRVWVKYHVDLFVARCGGFH